MTAKTKKTLGEELRSARETKGFTLRQVEEVTEISNAYLSQLEHDKIKKPSANVLYRLANLYGINFSHLLTDAGIIDSPLVETGTKNFTGNSAKNKAPHSLGGYALSSENLSPEEEKALVEYLKFIRFQKKK
ncbi:MAG: helix-turn-helix transcriptional regulator [Bacteroidia bacterium]|nr:helix-turn-helix transcriptional regulator [Bacteroidia bacterium]